MLRVVGWGAAVVFVVLLGLAVYQWITWPDVARLAGHNPRTTAFIDSFQKSARESEETVILRWEWIDWDHISPNIKAAVLVAEDIEFFSHEGFSISEIRAAILSALERGATLRGASTLTQQLAKNLWLSPSRNPLRKVKEALLTMQLERTLDKERVFELYLNVAEFGTGIYGVEAAASEYFGKSARHVDRAEAALLAAGLSRPSRWNPHSTSPGYIARAGRIEDLMAQHQNYLERRVGLQLDHIAITPVNNDSGTP